jgi:putative hemolysin
VQVGITVVSATAAAFGGASIAQRFAPLVADVPMLAPYAHQIALGLVVALVAYLSIVIGELVPKSVALHAAEQYALIVSRPLLALAWLARPLIWLLTQSSNLLLKPFGDRTTFTEARYSPDEIQQLVEDAMKSGSLHPGSAEIASRALDFHELAVSEVMVPRQDVVMVQQDASEETIHSMIAERPHTRLPVYGSSRDDIVGYVHIKDLAARSWQHDTLRLVDVLRAPFFVPESKSAVDLLRDMQQRRVPLAVVVDEQGGLAGIITIEDLVEELVGEIFSEHARDSVNITREPSGSVVVPGTMAIRDLNRTLGFDLPDDGDWNTVAGLCIGMAGHILVTGEKLTLPNGVLVEVVDASARRIRSLRIHAPHANGDEAQERTSE